MEKRLKCLPDALFAWSDEELGRMNRRQLMVVMTSALDEAVRCGDVEFLEMVADLARKARLDEIRRDNSVDESGTD